MVCGIQIMPLLFGLKLKIHHLTNAGTYELHQQQCGHP
jgi:hypothetical protein